MTVDRIRSLDVLDEDHSSDPFPFKAYAELDAWLERNSSKLAAAKEGERGRIVEVARPAAGRRARKSPA